MSDHSVETPTQRSPIIMKIHLQTPEEIRTQIWKELGRASLDRHHEWRTPVLASADADGLPEARTVVLRQVDAVAGQLTFYTDSRSPKVAQLQA
jgi:pyridoxine/pyridoxamine 5'-phosphate oxidase